MIPSTNGSRPPHEDEDGDEVVPMAMGLVAFGAAQSSLRPHAQ